MARRDTHVEYIVKESVYKVALANLPAGTAANQTIELGPITVREYRQNTSQTINAGKWVLWGISSETFVCEWRDGAWEPPANLVVISD
ncbi:hypothetical protein [Spirosoma utsteinense]|uniref:Uncharacterized protein n=1 Tax=Spirosoma utsteinense TaxID=2585773 RepID=A0ABR6W703_9BACT|nr:hypothetical protein [Spirosoma utsteinense]MBC3785620.1 hypothetical protein [Spirosoma utsteinense]MBC3791771.1 hypothetical protein [Spirosoma utsteinense]